MFKALASAAILAIALSSAALSNAQALTPATTSQVCLPIGGVANANFFSEGEGKPIIIAATLMGSVGSATGKVMAQRETPTGLEMDMEHYFGKTDGGFMLTKDLGVLTAIPGKPGRYMIEITYDITDVTRGSLKGFSGTFHSFGLVDMRDPNDMKGLVRYSGEICK